MFSEEELASELAHKVWQAIRGKYHLSDYGIEAMLSRRNIAREGVKTYIEAIISEPDLCTREQERYGMGTPELYYSFSSMPFEVVEELMEGRGWHFKHDDRANCATHA